MTKSLKGRLSIRSGLAVGFSIALATAAPVRATTFTISETGTVASTADAYNNYLGPVDDYGVFGPTGADLTGDAFTLTFSFNSADAAGSTNRQEVGGSSYGGGTFGSAILTINGHSYTFNGANEGDISVGASSVSAGLNALGYFAPGRRPQRLAVLA